MANEIQWRGTETGVTLYATIRSATGTQWNTAGTPNFEEVTTANWADYDIALAETTGNYFYVGTFPAISGNMVAGWYWVDVYKRAGGTPAITDTLQGTIVGYWNGTSLLPWASQLGPVTHTGAVVPTVTTLTGHTPQTGDCYARLGVPAGASHAEDVAAVKSDTAAVKAKTDNLPSDPADQSAVEAAITAATSTLATAANLATVAGYLDTEIAAILADTDELQKAITDGGRTDLLIDAIKAKTDAMLDAAATRTAVGLASANLDTQLSGINSKTTNLPSDPADQSAVEAAIAAVQSHGDSTWATATSVMVSDKAGFKLASDGLDSVATTAPTGPAANFREMIVQTWRRFFKRSTRTYSGGTQQIVTYADNGTTPVTTQTISDDGTTETQGVAS